MKAILYKIALGALSVLVGSTGIMIWAVIDVKFSAEAWEYFLLWLRVVGVCVALVVLHMLELKFRG